MLWREGWVKRFGAQSGIEFLESPRSHECEGPETPNVAVGEGTAVVESEADGYVAQRIERKRSVVDEECAGEARLDDDAVAAVERDDDGLGAAVAPLDACAERASRQ